MISIIKKYYANSNPLKIKKIILTITFDLSGGDHKIISDERRFALENVKCRKTQVENCIVTDVYKDTGEFIKGSSQIIIQSICKGNIHKRVTFRVVFISY